MRDLIEGAIEKWDEVLEKASGPTLRLGLSVQRAHAMGQEGVDDSVIAAQLTATSKRLGNGHVYDAKFAGQLRDLYEDSLSGTPIPSKTAKALIKDQRAVDPSFNGGPLTA